MSDKTPMDHIIDLTGQVSALRTDVNRTERERQEAQQIQQLTLDGVRALEQRMAAMPDTEHKDHHDFIKVLVTEHLQRQELRAAVIHKLATGGAWAAIIALGALLWQGIKHKTGTS